MQIAALRYFFRCHTLISLGAVRQTAAASDCQSARSWVSVREVL